MDTVVVVRKRFKVVTDTSFGGHKALKTNAGGKIGRALCNVLVLGRYLARTNDVLDRRAATPTKQKQPRDQYE